MSESKVPRSFGTHDGSFHADEVTACALLLLFNLIDQDKIIRSRNRGLLDTCEYVCDVGGVYDPERKLFDHHQADYKGTFSSAGMILHYLHAGGIIGDNEYRMFRDTLIRGVDDHDNGKDPQIAGYCTYSHVIANYRPILYDPPPEQEDAGFRDAMLFALKHLKMLLERHRYTQSCKGIVEKCMRDSKDFLLFDEGIPWLELFFELGGDTHSAEFVIMPSGGNWTLRCIPPAYDQRMKVRRPLPVEWAGLLEGELKRVSGIKGGIFCHKGRFISVWETREDAIKALDYVLSRKEIHS